MKLYAETPILHVRQVVADLWMVVWIVLWIWLGMKLYDLVLLLGVPGQKLADAGAGLESGLTDAGEKVSRVPLVGDDVRVPFATASDAGGTMRSAGEAQVHAVDNLALFLGITIAAMPIVILLVLWLPARVRFIRQARAAQKFIDADADLDLFALRALARQPMTELAKVHGDPAGAWRSRDSVVVRALATLELRAAGLRAPTLTPSGANRRASGADSSV
jgi:hypothetical protein